MQTFVANVTYPKVGKQDFSLFSSYILMTILIQEVRAVLNSTETAAEKMFTPKIERIPSRVSSFCSTESMPLVRIS